LHAVEVAVDVDLQQRCRVIGWATGRSGLNPSEAESEEVNLIDESVYDADGIILGDIVSGNRSFDQTGVSPEPGSNEGCLSASS